jgi:hypothetical protein
MKRKCCNTSENLTKRHKIAAVCFNLSLLLRTLLGVGTPKQWMAGAYNLLKALNAYLFRPTWQFALFAPKCEIFVSHFHKFLRISTPA